MVESLDFITPWGKIRRLPGCCCDSGSIRLGNRGNLEWSEFIRSLHDTLKQGFQVYRGGSGLIPTDARVDFYFGDAEVQARFLKRYPPSLEDWDEPYEFWGRLTMRPELFFAGGFSPRLIFRCVGVEWKLPSLSHVCVVAVALHTPLSLEELGNVLPSNLVQSIRRQRRKRRIEATPKASELGMYLVAGAVTCLLFFYFFPEGL